MSQSSRTKTRCQVGMDEICNKIKDLIGAAMFSVRTECGNRPDKQFLDILVIQFQKLEAMKLMQSIICQN